MPSRASLNSQSSNDTPRFHWLAAAAAAGDDDADNGSSSVHHLNQAPAERLAIKRLWSDLGPARALYAPALRPVLQA